MQFSKFFLIYVCVTSFLFLSTSTFAVTIDHGSVPFSLGAIARATGDAGRASVDAGDATVLNPALLMHLQEYTFTMSGETLNSAQYGDTSPLSVSFSDHGPDSPIPASIYYAQGTRVLSAGSYFTRDTHLAFADFMMNHVAIGVSLHYRQDSINTLTPELYNQLNYDLGFLYNPTAHLGLGLVFHDMGGGGDTLPQDVRLLRRIGIGMNYLFGKFLRVRLDALTGANNDLTQSTIMAGFESYVAESLVFRFGTQSNREESREMRSFGLGWVAPRFEIDWAYQMSPSTGDFLRHSIDLVIPF